MRVAVFGASGIIGQHMMLCVPGPVDARFFRRRADSLFLGCDVTNPRELAKTLDHHKPQVIINLAGESNTDAVERDPDASERINVHAATEMGAWVAKHEAHMIQVSTQAVFSGYNPPYGVTSKTEPINTYGRQKRQAEWNLPVGVTVIRPTFVLGVRPIATGRPNPAEQMLSGQRKQVADRWFSPLFARDAARGIWAVVLYGLGEGHPRIVHLGEPRKTNRYEIAEMLGVAAEPVSHDDFPGLAPRPRDTTYAADSARWFTQWADGFNQIQKEWMEKRMLTLGERAREIALFLRIPEQEAFDRLSRGFGALHHDVTVDFQRANPGEDPDRLLEWYRTTEAYIWELSAYHGDAGFNYTGMCRGVVDRLATAGARKVLCLGDGIGDLTLAFRRAGIDATYHDLAGSRTAAFAEHRFYMHGTPGPSEMTTGWEPQFSGDYDCIASFDFLEHVTDVPSWTTAIKNSLKPGGLFFAQNAFGLGSGPQGSMPMHLSSNDRFVKEWDPHLAGLGFRQLASNWYEVAA